MTTPDRHFDFKQNALPKRGKGILLLQVLGGSMIGELLGEHAGWYFVVLCV